MTLAVFGGAPVNREPWPRWPRLGERGPEYLSQVLESDRWSVSGPRAHNPTMNELACARFAKFCGAKFAFAVDHGSSALVAALLALEVGPGDEVIIPGLTWVACASAVLRVNGVPVPVDISPSTLCMDPDAIEAAITERTRAIMVVHLYSSMADLDRILDIARRRDLVVIEDAAQSHGAEWRGVRAGASGTIGAFSFHQGKPMATGEGGMVVTSSERLAEKLEQIRADGRRFGHGPIGRQHLVDVADTQGFNFCMSELHCALLMDALDRVEGENQLRANNAAAIDRYLFEGSAWRPVEAYPPNNKRTYYHYGVRFDEAVFEGCSAELVCAALEAELGYHIHTSYPPMNAFPLFAADRYSSVRSLPWSDALDLRGCPLPNAEEQHRRLVLLHHPILMSDESRLGAVADAFDKVARFADDLRSKSTRSG